MQRILVLVLAAALLPLALAQEPLPPLTAPPSQPELQAQAVVDEVTAFYADYRQAWDDRDLMRIANHLASDFIAVQYVPPQGVVQLDKVTALAGVGQFFSAMQGREMIWGRTLLTVVPRSTTEAVAVVRNDFTLRDAGGEVELTMEVLRKGADGRWRLTRKWSEKIPF